MKFKDYMTDIPVELSAVVPPGCVFVMHHRDVIDILTIDTEPGENEMLVRIEIELSIDSGTSNLLPEVLYNSSGVPLELTQCDKSLVIAAWRLPKEFHITKVLKVGEPAGGTLTLNANDIEDLR